MLDWRAGIDWRYRRCTWFYLLCMLACLHLFNCVCMCMCMRVWFAYYLVLYSCVYSCNNDLSNFRALSLLLHFPSLLLSLFDFPAVRIFRDFRRVVHVQFSLCAHDPIFSTLLVLVSTRLLVAVQPFDAVGSHSSFVFGFVPFHLSVWPRIHSCWTVFRFRCFRVRGIQFPGAVCRLHSFSSSLDPPCMEFIYLSDQLIGFTFLDFFGLFAFLFLAAAVCSGRSVRSRSLSASFTSWSRYSYMSNSHHVWWQWPSVRWFRLVRCQWISMRHFIFPVFQFSISVLLHYSSSHSSPSFLVRQFSSCVQPMSCTAIFISCSWSTNLDAKFVDVHVFHFSSSSFFIFSIRLVRFHFFPFSDVCFWFSRRCSSSCSSLRLHFSLQSRGSKIKLSIPGQSLSIRGVDQHPLRVRRDHVFIETVFGTLLFLLLGRWRRQVFHSVVPFCSSISSLFNFQKVLRFDCQVLSVLPIFDLWSVFRTPSWVYSEYDGVILVFIQLCSILMIFFLPFIHWIFKVLQFFWFRPCWCSFRHVYVLSSFSNSPFDIKVALTFSSLVLDFVS